MGKKTFKLISDFTVKSSDTEDSLVIEGYANTTVKDRVGDVIVAEAWKNGGTDNYLKNPIILAYHDHSRPIGLVTDLKVNSKGLKVTAKISKSTGEIFNLIKEGILKAFSIGFRVKDADYDAKTDIFVIKDLELYEISVVSVPANADSTFSVKKSLEEKEYNEFKEIYMTKETKTEESDVNTKEPSITKEDLVSAVKEILETTTGKSTTILEDIKKEITKMSENKEVKVEVGSTGAEKLLSDLTKRFEDQEKSFKEALEGIQGDLKEKAAELEAIQRSKMTFEDKKGYQPTDLEIDTAVLISKITGKDIFDTSYGKKLREKSNAEHWTGVTGNWETSFVTRVEDALRQKLVVEPLFTRRITMPTPVMYIPTNPDSGVAEWVKQSAITPGSSSGNNSSGNEVVHQVSDITLTAYKLATKEYIGYEEEDDSIIPLVPIIRDAIVRRTARQTDISLLRGTQNLGSAQGSGYNPLKSLGERADDTGTHEDTSVSAASGAVTVDVLGNLRRLLGIYGLNPSELVYVVSSDAYYDLLEDPDFRTMDLVGNKATILNGQIGSALGSPVVVSGEFAPKASGAYGAICANMSNFILGERSGLRIERAQQVVEQQNVLVATRRFGYVPITTGQGVSVLKYSA